MSVQRMLDQRLSSWPMAQNNVLFYNKDGTNTATLHIVSSGVMQLRRLLT